MWIALPFVILGSLVFKLGEMMMGGKLTYRKDDVIATFMECVTVMCTKCGHTKTGIVPVDSLPKEPVS